MEDLLIAGLNVKISPQRGSLYAKWMAVGYGIFSFGLIFLVEGRGILQATLTLNGLVGGILLGLFSLGIFFQRANAQGAFYGGILATFFVSLLAITAQIKNAESPFLNSSISECDCIANETSTINNDVNDNGMFSIFYQITYIYYSMIGTLLTIFFGLIISYLTEKRAEHKLLTKIAIEHEKLPGNRHLSMGSVLALQTQQRLTSFIRNVSQTTLRVEHKLKEVISHTNLHHLHPHGGDEERISILNEEEDQSEGNGSHMDTGRRKMFFIGYQQDDREHGE